MQYRKILYLKKKKFEIACTVQINLNDTQSLSTIYLISLNLLCPSLYVQVVAPHVLYLPMSETQIHHTLVGICCFTHWLLGNMIQDVQLDPS